MAELPTEEHLRTARRFPWQWAVIVLLSAVVSLFGMVIYNDRERITNLTRALATKDVLIAKKDSVIFNIYNELLYKNNIIDRQKTVIDHTDSIARKRLEKPAKQILKINE